MLILIDNYDSFTYNLVHYFEELGEQVSVFRNDEITVDKIFKLNPDYLVISPGPSSPKNSGICMELVKKNILNNAIRIIFFINKANKKIISKQWIFIGQSLNFNLFSSFCTFGYCCKNFERD